MKRKLSSMVAVLALVIITVVPATLKAEPDFILWNVQNSGPQNLTLDRRLKFQMRTLTNSPARNLAAIVKVKNMFNLGNDAYYGTPASTVKLRVNDGTGWVEHSAPMPDIGSNAEMLVTILFSLPGTGNDTVGNWNEPYSEVQVQVVLDPDNTVNELFENNNEVGTYLYHAPTNTWIDKDSSKGENKKGDPNAPDFGFGTTLFSNPKGPTMRNLTSDGKLLAQMDYSASMPSRRLDLTFNLQNARPVSYDPGTHGVASIAIYIWDENYGDYDENGNSYATIPFLPGLSNTYTTIHVSLRGTGNDGNPGDGETGLWNEPYEYVKFKIVLDYIFYDTGGEVMEYDENNNETIEYFYHAPTNTFVNAIP